MGAPAASRPASRAAPLGAPLPAREVAPRRFLAHAGSMRPQGTVDGGTAGRCRVTRVSLPWARGERGVERTSGKQFL